MPEENSSNNEMRSIFVEAPSGERFEAEVPCDTKLSKVAADFFEAQNWPMQDRRGRGQRAVVELVNPNNPDDTKRLNGDDDICESGVENADVLRIFPESIAGAVDHLARMRALVADHAEMQSLCQRNSNITFTTNRDQAPDLYEITFHYPSFTQWIPGQDKPDEGDVHRVRIMLRANYPRKAPLVIWQTPIFHPNIRPSDGAVCLGALMERYLPGLGLARIVQMLAEMVQWRNFDAFNPFNKEAAKWAADSKNWKHIEKIGGHPIQGPIEQFLKELDRNVNPPIVFKPVSSNS